MKNKTKKIILLLLAIFFIPFSVQALIAYPLNQGGTGWDTSTKGDLLVGTSSISKYSRLPVGANGYLLTASSTSPIGLVWVATSTLGIISGSNATTTWLVGNGFLYTATSTDGAKASYFIATSTTASSTFTNGFETPSARALTSAGLGIYAGNSTLVGLLGAGNTANVAWYGSHTMAGNLIVDTNTLYVNSTTDNVSIGTTTGNAKLTVQGTTGSADNILTVSSSTNPFYQILSNGNQRWGTVGNGVGEKYAFDGSIRIAANTSSIATGAGTTPNGIWSFGVTDFIFTPDNGGTGNSFYMKGTTGSFGIGTSTPISTLSVKGYAGVDLVTIASSTGARLFNILQNGNVGIGVTTPLYPLHVVGTGYVSNILGVGAVPSGSYNFEVTGASNFTSTTYFRGITYHFNNINNYFGMHAVGTVNKIFTTAASTNKDIVIQPGDVTSATFAFGGNVGIGSTTPNALFVVSGTTTSPTNDLFVVASSSNAQFLTIKSTGNVGVGSSSPVAKLTVVGTASSPTATLLNVASSSNASILSVTSIGNVGIGSTSPSNTLFVQGRAGADPFVVASSTGTNLLTLLQNGYFGIGISPAITLDVYGAGTAIGRIGNPNGSFSMGFDGSGGYFQPFTASKGFYFYNAAGTSYMGVSGAGGVGVNTTSPGSTFSVNGSASLGTYATNAAPSNGLVVSGNVGIGTTTVSEKLTVASGNVLLTGEYALKWTGGSQLYEQTAAVSGVDRMIYRPNGDRFDVITENGASFMAGFRLGEINLYTNGTSRLYLDGTGNVGIASSTPNYNLSVTGTVAFPTLTSSGTGNAVCISTVGQILNAGGGTCTPSSIKFKENVDTLKQGTALSIISKLRSVSFDYKEKQAFETNHSYGMIAEEVEKIDKNLVDYDVNGEVYSIHFEKVTGLLVQAVNELAQSKGMVNAKRSTEENYQWIIIGLLAIGYIRLNRKINKLTK